MKAALKFLMPMVVAFAAIGAPDIFIGGELVPFHFGSATYAVPFAALGAYWPMDGIGFAATVGSDSPLIPSGWYFLSLEGRGKLSKALFLGVGVTSWVNFQKFTLTDFAWSFYVKGGALLSDSFLLYGAFNIPTKANPDLPLFGAWVTVGFGFNFALEANGGGGG